MIYPILVVNGGGCKRGHVTGCVGLSGSVSFQAELHPRPILESLMHRVRTALACLVFVAAGLPANFSDSKDFRLNSESALVAPISTNYSGTRFKKTDRFLTAGISIAY